LKNAFGALFLFVFIYLISQLINELPFYLKTTLKLPPVDYIMLMYLFRIPYALVLLAPAAFLFSTIFTLANMYKNNEVVAAIASGVYLFRFTRPIWVVGLLFSTFLVFFSELVAVPSWDKAQTMNETIRRRSDKRKDQFNLSITGEDNMFYSMQRYDAKNKVMMFPTVIKERYNVNYVESPDFDRFLKKYFKDNRRARNEEIRRENSPSAPPRSVSGVNADAAMPRAGSANARGVRLQDLYKKKANKRPASHIKALVTPRADGQMSPPHHSEANANDVIDPVTLRPNLNKFRLHMERSSRPDIPLYVMFRLDAEKIFWNNITKKWIVTDGILRYWDKRQGLLSSKVKRVKNWVLPSTDLPYHFEKNIKKIVRMSLAEGFRYIAKLKRSNKKYLHELVDLYGQKFAFQFGAFIVIFVGMTLGQFHSRKQLFIQSLLMSILIFIAYYIFFQIGNSLGKEAVLHPFFAPWIGNLGFMALAFALMRKAKT
jgi:lipopolysaccharide export LptBFGC system permease protein LptF